MARSQESEWLVSRRDGPIVAGTKGLGPRHPKSRPVGYGLIRAGERTDLIGSDKISNPKYLVAPAHFFEEKYLWL
jgi:hypothetical protein